MSVQNVWTYFFLLCLIGWVMPSVRIAHFYFNLNDTLCTILFPTRALVNKFIICKNDVLYAYTNIRTKKGVNAVAVIWYIVYYIAIVVFAVLSLMGNLAALNQAFLIVLYIWIALLFPFVIGLFLGDRKYKVRTQVEETDADAIHAQEQLLAHYIDKGIEDCQAVVANYGYRWRIDVLCTDRLDDETNRSMMGTIAALSGVAQTNPFYMSRVLVTLLDEEDQPVAFPAKRRNEHEFAFTQGPRVYHFKPDYLADTMIDLVCDVTRMVEYKKK